MHVRRLATCVEVQTPAKLNLFLEVLGKRDDGYHEIETLIVGLGLYDTLIFTPTDTREITLHCRWASGVTAERNWKRNASASDAVDDKIPSGPQNLIWRAVGLLGNEAGVRSGASIELVKRIPAAAGLGGGSSDAAAALVAANLGWQLNWPRERLAELAAKIGSDVPFFLAGGAAICRGRGERIEKIAARRIHAVVVRPPVGISTADVYKACQVAEKPTTVDRIESDLARGDPAEIARMVTNGLQPAAEGLTAWIAKLKTRFEGADVLGHQMSGSGSSYFGICRSARSARRVAARFRARRSGAVFAATTAAATR
jgi:4-diphosphocytidyl-2-C-methyl-D-erythritol kinase